MAAEAPNVRWCPEPFRRRSSRIRYTAMRVSNGGKLDVAATSAFLWTHEASRLR